MIKWMNFRATNNGFNSFNAGLSWGNFEMDAKPIYAQKKPKASCS